MTNTTTMTNDNDDKTRAEDALLSISPSGAVKNQLKINKKNITNNCLYNIYFCLASLCHTNAHIKRPWRSEECSM